MTGFSANRCWLWLLLITLFRPANARIATGHHPLRKRLLDLPKGPSPLADANLLKAHPGTSPRPNLLLDHPTLDVTSSRVTDSRSNPIRPNHDGRPKPPPDGLDPPRSGSKTWPPPPPVKLESEEPQLDSISTSLLRFQQLLKYWTSKAVPPPSAEQTIVQGTAAIENRVAKAVKRIERLKHQAKPPEIEMIQVNRLSKPLLERLFVENHNEEVHEPGWVSLHDHPDSYPHRHPPPQSVEKSHKHETIERPLRLASEKINRLYFLGRKSRLSASTPQPLPVPVGLPAGPGKADSQSTVQLLENTQHTQPSVATKGLPPTLGRQIAPNGMLKLTKTESPSVPTIQVHDKLLMNPRNDALLAPASRVVVPSYSKTSGIRHGPPIILGKDIIPEQRPPQPRHNRVSVILISKIWKKEPLSVAVLLIDQNLSQKEGQTSIHIFLDPELHKQITTWYSALFKYQGGYQKRIKASQVDPTLELGVPLAKEMSATQKMHPPNDMVFSMGKPPPSLSAPPLHHFSSQRAPQLKYQHLLKEEASSSEPRSLFKMNGIKALFGTFNRVAGVRSQFIKSLLDRGAQIYSELPKNHAFDEARKLAIMNTVKTWTTSGQNTVGQAISRLRSFIRPVPRRKPSIELQPGLYVEGLTMPENKLTLVPIPRPHRQGSPRDISQAKVSLGGVPDGEQPSAVDHFVALQNQPRQSESSHLPALRVPKVWTEKPIEVNHWLGEITRSKKRPISIQILLDHDTYSKILTIYSALFKSSSKRPERGTESRQANLLPQLESPTTTTTRNQVVSNRRPWHMVPYSDPHHGTIVIKSQHPATANVPRQASHEEEVVLELIGGEAFLATLNTIFKGYNRFYKSLLHQSSEMYSVSTTKYQHSNPSKKWTLMSTFQALSISNQKPFTRIVSQIRHITSEFPTSTALAKPPGNRPRITLAFPYKSEVISPRKQLQIEGPGTPESHLAIPSVSSKISRIYKGLGNTPVTRKPAVAPSPKVHEVIENLNSLIHLPSPERAQGTLPKQVDSQAGLVKVLEQSKMDSKTEHLNPGSVIPGSSVKPKNLLAEAQNGIEEGTHPVQAPPSQIRESLGNFDNRPDSPPSETTRHEIKNVGDNTGPVEIQRKPKLPFEDEHPHTAEPAPPATTAQVAKAPTEAPTTLERDIHHGDGFSKSGTPTDKVRTSKPPPIDVHGDSEHDLKFHQDEFDLHFPPEKEPRNDRRKGFVNWLIRLKNRILKPLRQLKRFIAFEHLMRTSRPPI
ncbi:hypothetical protein Pst134EA_028818 [Puccinia striiformis f. sp. tritici]|uniref:hypothetical protein n=1 Tax=Puccinia striiformis f. sp. tritici TaxID=168172 RepID=UPI00200740A2|nr:hypothetical protein Pst134EA_028818 [Puccinia striiformis f. sp. tritici]KAH9446829.1 hypothetical protein Pst134EA_028818 [Puccinia striiformis f. sp. tritici]